MSYKEEIEEINHIRDEMKRRRQYTYLLQKILRHHPKYYSEPDGWLDDYYSSETGNYLPHPHVFQVRVKGGNKGKNCVTFASSTTAAEFDARINKDNQKQTYLVTPRLNRTNPLRKIFGALCHGFRVELTFDNMDENSREYKAFIERKRQMELAASHKIEIPSMSQTPYTGTIEINPNDSHLDNFTKQNKSSKISELEFLRNEVERLKNVEKQYQNQISAMQSQNQTAMNEYREMFYKLIFAFIEYNNQNSLVYLAYLFEIQKMYQTDEIKSDGLGKDKMNAEGQKVAVILKPVNKIDYNALKRNSTLTDLHPVPQK